MDRRPPPARSCAHQPPQAGRGRLHGGRGDALIRKSDDECCALAGRAFDRHVAAQHGTEALGDGEPKTGAAEALGGRGIRLAERLKEPAELLLRHADAGVRHAEADLRTALARYSQGQRAFAR